MTDTVVVAILVSTVAPTIATFVTSWLQRRREQAQWRREDQMAKRLRKVDREKLDRLSRLQRTADGTHVIVNNQRTLLLRLCADLRARIARENPNDVTAQEAAVEADQEARRAESANITAENL